ncbi:Sodium channel protein type 11 subunit alpha, partial [Durusdinium trenchii]
MAEPDAIRGKSTGVFVERPHRPGKVFKLRDIRPSKEVPPASADGSQSREPTPSQRDRRGGDSSLRHGHGHHGRDRERSGEAHDRPERPLPRRHHLPEPEPMYRRDPSPLRYAATSSRDFMDFRGHEDRWESSRSPSRDPGHSHYSYGFDPGSWMPSRQSAHEVYDRGPPIQGPSITAPPFEPVDDFKSWLRGVLESERDAVREVMRGRHSEILSQLKAKLEDPPKPKPPPHQPTQMTIKRMEPDPPGVLVVTEDWAGPRPNDSSPTKKVVSLTDDTDAKSAGDESRSCRPSILSENSQTLAARQGQFESENETVKSRGNMSVRMTHSIPHLRKNSLLEGIAAMPFWHPGRYVHTTQFDALFCGVILANTLVMALEMQYTGFQRGYELGFPHFTVPASEYWPQAATVFQAL